MPITAEEAKTKYGHRYDRYLHFRQIGDPLADAVVKALDGATTPEAHAMIRAVIERGPDAVPNVPKELRELYEFSAAVPYWVDYDLMKSGSAMFERNAALMPMIVSAMALPFGYSTQSAKTLAFTLVMSEYATKRLRETNRQMLEVGITDGMRVGNPGWQICVQVRMIHAIIRNQIASKNEWDWASYGSPLHNLHLSMLASVLGSYVIEGLRKLSRPISEEEEDGYISIWKYASYLMGVDPELLCSNHVEGMRHLGLIFDLELDPSEESIQLIHQLYDRVGPVGGIMDEKEGKRLTNIVMALSRSFVGDEFADKLRLPSKHEHFTHAAFMAIVHSDNFLEHFLPKNSETVRDIHYKLFKNLSYYSGETVLAAFDLPSKIGDD